MIETCALELADYQHSKAKNNDSHVHFADFHRVQVYKASSEVWVRNLIFCDNDCFLVHLSILDPD